MKKQKLDENKKCSIIKRLKLRKEQREMEEFKNKTELEKIEERREEVLSKGRKFKYPLQYAPCFIQINATYSIACGFCRK